MFPLDSFRLARTLAATSAGVLAVSAALGATGAPYKATAALAALACLLAYAARYDAARIRKDRRRARLTRTFPRTIPTPPLKTSALIEFAARELAALEAGRVTPTPALTLVDLEGEAQR